MGVLRGRVRRTRVRRTTGKGEKEGAKGLLVVVDIAVAE